MRRRRHRRHLRRPRNCLPREPGGVLHQCRASRGTLRLLGRAESSDLLVVGELPLLAQRRALESLGGERRTHGSRLGRACVHFVGLETGRSVRPRPLNPGRRVGDLLLTQRSVLPVTPPCRDRGLVCACGLHSRLELRLGRTRTRTGSLAGQDGEELLLLSRRLLLGREVWLRGAGDAHAVELIGGRSAWASDTEDPADRSPDSVRASARIASIVWHGVSYPSLSFAMRQAARRRGRGPAPA